LLNSGSRLYVVITGLSISYLTKLTNWTNQPNKQTMHAEKSLAWEVTRILRSCDRSSLMYSSITNKMQRHTMIVITINALHVSGGSSAQHQELKTVYTASGICRAFIVINIIVWRCILLVMFEYKLPELQMVRNTHFMQAEGSLPCSQEPTNGPPPQIHTVYAILRCWRPDLPSVATETSVIVTISPVSFAQQIPQLKQTVVKTFKFT
jgi:hypothetical protein